MIRNRCGARVGGAQSNVFNPYLKVKKQRVLLQSITKAKGDPPKPLFNSISLAQASNYCRDLTEQIKDEWDGQCH